MKGVHAVQPDINTRALLAGARFIDAYSIAVDDALAARRAADLLGRTYLAIILPFHRVVVRAMLRQDAG
jgi:hypothetical protein